MNNKEQIINGIMQNCKEVHLGKLKVPFSTRAILCDGNGICRGNQFINTDASAVTQWSLVSITSWTKRYIVILGIGLFPLYQWDSNCHLEYLSLSLLKLICGHTLIPLTRENRINCESH